METLIETPRLIIRQLTMADEEGMFAMDSDPEVHRYIANKPSKSIQETRETIAYVVGQYAEFGIGRWAVIEKATGAFVGWVGHKYMAGPVNGHTNYYDFGYRLAQKFWGLGYATEAGSASLHYGIDTVGLKDIYAMTDVSNAASRRVLEKIGFKYVETFPYDARPDWRKPGEPATWYQWPAEGAKKSSGAT